LPRLTKTKLAIPALIVLLVAVAGGYQVFSQHQARAALDATLANLPAGSVSHYDSMSFNAFTQTLRIGGLAITRDGHPSLTVQQVTLHHLEGSGSLADPFKAGAVRLVETELWRGSRRLTIAVVDAANVKVLASVVPPPPGTPRWLVAPGSGTLLAAGAMTAGNIEDNEGATVSALSIADYADGQLRQASARGFADAHGNRIASVGANAVDLDGLDAVFDTGRYGPGAPSWPVPRPLIGHAEIMGLQSRNETATATIASIALDGFAARPFVAAPTGAYVKTQAFLRDAAAAVSVGAASITGVHYQDTRTRLAGMLSALSVSGYADGALAQASLDGLAFSGTGPSQVAIGHFEMIGLNATKLLQRSAGESTLSLVEAARHGGVALTSLALRKVSFTPATGQTITLDSVDQSTTGTAPTHFTARLRGLDIPARSNPELAQGLGALGVDRLVFDLDETGAYDTAAGTAALDPLVLTARGLGSLNLSAQFTGVPDDLPQTGSPLAALAGMNIGPFVLRFTNERLVQRVVAMEARQAGKTPQDVTDEAKLAASFAAAALVPDQADAGQQVAAFIADPHVLTITATPAAPIPFGAFLGTGRDTAKSALNLRVTAN
jgi:hypothetical protein